MRESICVLGSGAWGTALAVHLNRNAHRVMLWSRRPETAQTLRDTMLNPRLPGVVLPYTIRHSSDLACVQGHKLVVVSVPSFAVRETCRAFAPYLDDDAVLISAAKGIEPGTGLRMSQIIAEETGCRVAVLSGPSHAEEVSRGIPTGLVVACEDRQLAERIQDAFASVRLRVYSSPDVVGAELGGALKNVIALCAGIGDGMGYGDNARALLMTRGLTEMARLGMAMGSRPETFAGLTGVGDLIVTCCSHHSRNHSAGVLIGQGKTPEQAMAEVGAVVEGYYCARSALELARRAGVEMPIAEQAYEVLYHGKSAQKAIKGLMLRNKTVEIEDAGWS
ncbi:MAG: NAD(P)-dependent glycerol-3-phosphate dehydrogenase [Ruminococcaceae bacterium]|nr:NAD(P)-dependent glycerol-3-phosphate dehydrogenase [Oscillospiraceae bacterium]